MAIQMAITISKFCLCHEHALSYMAHNGEAAFYVSFFCRILSMDFPYFIKGTSINTFLPFDFYKESKCVKTL